MGARQGPVGKPHGWLGGPVTGPVYPQRHLRRRLLTLPGSVEMAPWHCEPFLPARFVLVSAERNCQISTVKSAHTNLNPRKNAETIVW